MHSFEHASGVVIHHNGDHSGFAKVMIPARIIDKKQLSSDVIYLDSHGNLWINDVIPARVIADYGFDATINQAITALENLEPSQYNPETQEI